MTAAYVYIGNPEQYQSYQSIARQQQQTTLGWQPRGGAEEAGGPRGLCR